MTYECISFSITGKVDHLILNRPATLNTMQPVLWRELTEVLETLQRDALQQMGWLQSGIWRTGNLMEACMAKQQGRTPQFDDLPPMRSFSEAKYDLK